MTKRVLIIGGYGNFGGIIATALAKDANIKLLIGGRSEEKAKKFIAGLKAVVPPEAVTIDITYDVYDVLEEMKPDIVVHTTGPFQLQNYRVVEACIRLGCHYIDLADARMFVPGISQYDEQAKESNVLAVSGASSIPCLTAAVIDYHLRNRFSSVEKIDYGITAAQQTNRGRATTAAVLSYAGEPFFTLTDGEDKKVYGWQGLHTHKYPEIGQRLFGNCDIPDLELFPPRYPDLHTIRFSAGTEIAALHIGLWLLSWVVRVGLILPLDTMTPLLMKIARLFDPLAKNRSGFHMLMYGKGKKGEPRAEAFYIIAKSGHGAHIPCMPAIFLAKGLANDTLTARGARPCLDFIDLETYVGALKGLDIRFIRGVPLAIPKPDAKAKPKPKPKPKPQLKPKPQPGEEAGEGYDDDETGEATPDASAADAPEGAYSYKKDSAVPEFPDDKPLFVFDGVCVLCSRTVAWLMRGPKGEEFRYASAQSPLGQALYRHYGLEMNDTYLLIDKGVAYTKSEGYIHMFGLLGPPWHFLYALKEIPAHLRDKLYDLVARNRYKWFGKTKTECERIPEEFRENMLK